MKKRNKVSAEFSMSSLTDIIFLLLIFFMLTSSMVIPNALNLKLPGKKSSSPPSQSKQEPLKVTIDPRGTYFLNGSQLSIRALNDQLREAKRVRKNKATVTIEPSKKAGTEKVVAVMDIAYRYGIEAIMTDAK